MTGSETLLSVVLLSLTHNTVALRTAVGRPTHTHEESVDYLTITTPMFTIPCAQRSMLFTVGVTRVVSHIG